MSNAAPITQSVVDKMIDEFKTEVDGLCEGKSLSLAMVSNRDILEGIYAYQETLVPQVQQLGLKAPTLSELFGVDITLTIKTPNITDKPSLTTQIT